jgi:hypothetical protein
VPLALHDTRFFFFVSLAKQHSQLADIRFNTAAISGPISDLLLD